MKSLRSELRDKITTDNRKSVSKRDTISFFQENLENKFSLIDYKTRKNCSYYIYGKTQIKQIVKYCEVCDPNHGEAICEDCMENCHKSCSKNLTSNVDGEDNKFDHSIFACECGRKKHFIENRVDSALIAEMKCCLLDLDIKLKNRMYYWCTYCRINILCFICYSYCHASPKCKSSRRKKDHSENMNINDLDNLYEIESPNKGKKCQCTNSNHSSIISMNTYINYLLANGRFSYDVIPFVWKLQIVNCLFDSDVPQKLFFPVERFFQNFSINDNSDNKKIDDLFKNTMIRVTNNIFTNLSIVYFNYHSKIIQMFPYEKLVVLLQSFKDKDLYESSELIKSILHIILYVHLKKDFQDYKNYCVYDFMVGNVLDRLTYRKFIHSESIYTDQIHEKYYDKIKGKFTLPDLTNHIANIFVKSYSMYKKEGLSKCMKNYFVCLKIIFFNLKRMTYDLQTLIEFIEIYEKISSILYTKLKDIVNRYKEIKIKNDFTYNWWIQDKGLFRIMSVITKITYLVIVNYNDLITLEFLNNKKNFNYIQVNTEHSSKLMRILINSSMYYSTFILNNDIYHKDNIETNSNPTPGIKFLNMFNKAVELFTVTDNLYFKKLETVKPHELSYFYYLQQKISAMRNKKSDFRVILGTLDVITGFSGGVEVLRYKEITIDSKENNFEIVFKKMIFNLKQKIEGCIDLFFSYKISLPKLYEKVKFLVEQVGIEDNYKEASISQMNNVSSRQFKEANNSKSMNFKGNKINKFKKKILRLNQDLFSFVFEEGEIQNISEEKIDVIVEELIFSNIDITFTKLFMIDFKQLNYPLDSIDVLFKFLSLYCLNKEGLKYFYLGRNIRRIIKMLDKYPKRTIEFICLIFKGAYIYEIDISYHKRLNELMTSIKNHIRSFIISNESQESEFKEFLTYTIKFLQLLNRNLTIEELMIIRKQIFEYVDEKKLLDKEKIIRTFPVCYNIDELPENPVDKDHQEKSNFYLEDNDINLDYVREIFEKERRFNKNKMPLNKTRTCYSEKIFTFIENGKDKSSNNATILQKDKDESKLMENGINLKEMELGIQNNKRLNHYYNSILNVNYLKYSESKVKTRLNKSIKNYSLSQMEKDHKFFFAFIKLIAKFTHYFLNNDQVFSVINNFNDLEFYKFLLNKNYLSLKHRTNLLIYLRSIYFTDILDGTNLSRDEKYLGSDKYPKYLKYYTEYVQQQKDTFIDPHLTKWKAFKEKGYFTKMDNMNYMKSVIEIFIQELQNLILFIYLEQDKIDSVEEYLSELLFSIKIISDVYITYDISSHMALLFYELTKEFLKKINIFKSFLNHEKIDELELLEQCSPRVNSMESREFDIYDTETIYYYILEAFNDIYNETSINSRFKLEYCLENYQISKDRNFKVFCLIDKENLYDSFIENQKSLNIHLNTSKNSAKGLNMKTNELENKDSGNLQFKKFKIVIDNYIKQFLDIYHTTFMYVVNSYNDMEIDYSQIFFNFCLSYIFHMENLSSENLTSIILTLNKLLTYNTKSSQQIIKQVLVQNELSDIFFIKYCNKLQEKLNINIVTSKNFLIYDRYDGINTTTKIIIQFIQLLGEGHFKEFLNFILTGRGIDEEEKSTIAPRKTTTEEPYEKTIKYFKVKVKKDQIDKFDDLNYKYPEKFIFHVLTETLQNCIEKIDIKKNFRGGCEMPYDKLIILIGNIIDCMVEFFQGTPIKMLNKMYEILKPALTPMKTFMFYKSNEELSLNPNHPLISTRKNVFLIVKINIINLLMSIIQEGNTPSKIRNEILSYFQPLDLFEEIILSFKDFIVELKYLKKLRSNFDIENYKMNTRMISKLTKLYIYDTKFQNSLQLKFSLKIFYFLKFLAEVYSNQTVTKFFYDLELYEEVKPTNDKLNLNSLTTNSNSTFVMYKFLSQLLKKIEIRSRENESENDYVYFVIPPVCFLLSNQSMDSFIHNVDRESIHSKIVSLITVTDYFIYEMFYINRLMNNFSDTFLNRELYNINLFKCEIINYLVIAVQNILLLYHFYKSPNGDITLFNKDEKYFIFTDSLVISAIQLFFLLFILLIWIKYKFFLYFQYNLMKIYRKKFIFLKNAEEKTGVAAESVDNLLDNFNTDIGFGSKLKVALVDTILENRQVNVFVFTAVLLILYITTKSSLFLVIPLLFAANLSSILFGIVLAVKMRWVQMLAVLFYTYLLVYFFSWIAFYYYYDSYTFHDALDIKNQTTVIENFCTSPIQCYLMNLNYGVRSGGGIGDVITKISYQFNTGYFVSRFFYDILFHMTIVLFMSNLFFGIIVDTFADLRDKNNRIENDKNNVCFICQIDRDNAMNSNIDFDKHVKTDHYIWNYVYFIAYLHINNPSDFKYLESYVWSKIHLNDTAWIPIYQRHYEVDESENH